MFMLCMNINDIPKAFYLIQIQSLGIPVKNREVFVMFI